MDNEIMERYSIIKEKNKREIILLRGSGCKWRRCRFCDYHLDFSNNEEENYNLNKAEIEKVQGIYEKLEVINSGSFVDLNEKTMVLLEETCKKRNIKEIHFECHWNHKEMVQTLRKRFEDIGVKVKVKIGVETFNSLFRESYLDKGIDTNSPEEIAMYFDEACLLFGIPGQNKESMLYDIETGLKYFDRICINIMQENGKPIKPAPKIIDIFAKEIYPIYENNDRVDILMENTAFGVGGVLTNAK
ncbi:MAG: radical SAM protein [Lachnotalea sp.]